ncbi:hypothetical protein F3Y22_tig00112528pilonHSYRG00030 [Hibiscus syriacus]|uniref:RING-type domain-containing protein n=1 Tax=Hibiscus syriacus TaxID=106335 RepID=A0A6A2WWR5_HIBSY|nr:hypothetical protein F3Y22_tig00112528pilonHSYRG00030 [Hibiscus syriacus]
MGFPVGYTQVFLPKLFLHTLLFLGFIRYVIVALSTYLELSDFLETDTVWQDTRTRTRPKNPPISAPLIREILPVVKFDELFVVGNPPESCAVCLYEFEGGEEIRWLRNCRHVFHRACLDCWVDHDQKTCPLCRTPFVPDELQGEFNQRLWLLPGSPIYTASTFRFQDCNLHSEYNLMEVFLNKFLNCRKGKKDFSWTNFP